MEIKDITPHNIRNFIEGNKNFIFSSNLPKFYLEQFYYRAYLCRNCLVNGKCIKCGCATPAMFFAPRKSDALGKWPEFFFSEDRWEEFKQGDDYRAYKELLLQHSIDVHSDDYLSDIVTKLSYNSNSNEQGDRKPEGDSSGTK